GPRSLIASFHLELDVLSFLQAFKVETLEAAAMKENLLAVGGADKPKSAIANDPLDCSLHSYLDLREEGPAFSCRSKTKGGTEVTEESLLHCGATLPIANSFVKRQLSVCRGKVRSSYSSKVESSCSKPANWPD